MSRDISAANVTASSAAVMRPVRFVEMQFDTDTLRLWSGIGMITAFSNEYIGIGTLGEIETISVQADGKPAPLRLSIGNIPNSYLSRTLNEEVQGRTIKIWSGFVDEDFVLVADPTLDWQGALDTLEVEVGAKSFTCQVTAESIFVEWGNSTVTRYTNADQQTMYSGDLAFEFVSQLQDQQLEWGGRRVGMGALSDRGRKVARAFKMR